MGNFIRNAIAAIGLRTRLLKPAGTRRQVLRRRIEIDTLESRLLMTARVWDGSGGISNTNWSNRFNWTGDVAPVTGDELVFPNTAPSRVSKNDFAAGSRTFAAISFTPGGTGGYQINGNAIRLTSGITVGSVTGFQHTIDAKIDFVGAATHSINVGDQTILNLNFAVSSSNGFAVAGPLTKLGTGRLILAGSNTFSTSFTVQAGIVQMAHKNAFGAATGSTTIIPGAAIHLEEFIGLGEEFPRDLTNAEPLVLLGTGIASTGALRNVSGNNRWNGTISLGAGLNNSIGVDESNGEFAADELTINGVIKDSSPGGFHKRGIGRLNLAGTNTYRSSTLIDQGIIRMRNSSALGSTLGLTRVQSGAALELDDISIGGGETASLSVAEPLQMLGSGIGNTGALRNIEGFNAWVGTVTLLANSSARVDLAGDTLTISGLINGADGAGLTTSGLGELRLTANNTYNGTTILNSGNLTVNGTQPASSVLVNGGTLQGTGTVGATTIRTGGTISPAGNATGTINVQGNLSVAGTIRINVSPSTNDNINVTGSANIGRAPILVTGTTSATSLTVVTNDRIDAVLGATNGTQITSAAGQNFLISYTGGTGNDVVLNRVNVAPMFANRHVTSQIDEGDDVILSGTIVDPDALDAFFLSVDWGDGQTSGHTFRPGDSRDVYLAHTYVEQDNYSISLTWTDPARQGNSGKLQTVVNNVAPTLSGGNTATVALNSLFSRRLQFTDPGRDSFTALVNYGDESATETQALGGSKTINLSHRFTRKGAFRVTVLVLDDDGGVGTDNFFVIVT